MSLNYYDSQLFRTVAGERLFDLIKDTVDNTETPTPTPVGFYRRDYVPAHNFSTENTAIYTRIDHRPGQIDFRYWLYGEITEQSIEGGSLTKVIHRGAGDAHYVAMMGNNTSGYGYESAMFGGWQDPPHNRIPKQENGFIATFQGSGGFQESVKNQGNSVGFQALVHDDGVDPTDPDPWATNYALFYANNALSNAFVVRRSEYAQNFSMFKLMDHTAKQRPIWQVFADGQQWLNGEEATAGDTSKPSPPFLLRGYYWAGSAEQANQTQLSHQTGGAGGGVFRVDIGNPGSEALVLQVNERGEGTFLSLVRVGHGSTFRSPTNGTVILANSDGDGFTQLHLGPADSAHPMLKISGTTTQFRRGDDWAWTNIIANRIDAVGPIYGAGLGISGKVLMQSTGNGNLRLSSWDGSDFRLIQFGGISNSFPALKRSSTELQARLADNSDYCNFAANQVKTSGGIGEFGSTPPASQPAAIADVPTGGSATAAANATAINAILAVLRTRGTIAT